MNGLKAGVAIFLGIVLLGACAETPRTIDAPETSQSNEALEALPEEAVLGDDGATRLVIYRTSFAGFAVQPKVFVDDQHVAQCTPGRATTLKVNPGTHQITAKTLSEKALTVSVPEGGTAYVRCSIGIGLLVGGAKLVAVPAAEAAPRAAKLNQIASN